MAMAPSGSWWYPQFFCEGNHSVPDVATPTSQQRRPEDRRCDGVACPQVPCRVERRTPVVGVVFVPNETKLEQAARHVLEGRRIVARQRALVERTKAAGHDTALSEQILVQFEQTLAIFAQPPKPGSSTFLQGGKDRTGQTCHPSTRLAIRPLCSL
jgi:hypothetical protein